MVETTIRKAIIALLLASLLVIPACSGLSSRSEVSPELRARWEQAAYYGWPADVPVLLEAGVDVNLKDKDGVTALMIAGMRINTETVLALLDAGADVNANANNGATALMMAGTPAGSSRLLGWRSKRFQLGKDNTGTVRALLDAGADVNARDQGGVAPLMIYGARANRATVLALLDAGADVKAKDNNGMSALSYAAREGYADILRTLLDMGAHLNKGDNLDQPTALMAAAERGHTEIVNLLLGTGAEVDYTALKQAAPGGHFEIVRTLLDAGAGDRALEQALSEASQLALEQAARWGHFEIVRSLLDAGADPNQYVEKSALMWAAGAQPLAFPFEDRERRTRIVRLLLDAGARVNEKDHLGFTPLKWAQMRDRPGVLELLRIAGTANGTEVTEAQVGKVIPDTMANEARAISSLKSLVRAQLIFHSRPSFWGEGGGPYGTLSDLLSAGLIEDRLASARRDGYIFSVSFNNSTFHLIATPLTYRVTGARSFYADETGVIRYTREDRPATAVDQPL